MSLLLNLLSLALRVVNLALLVYCIMSFVMPTSQLYHTLGRYIRPLLDPVRRKLWQWFPKLRTLPVDVSPLALWLAMDILSSVINMLRRAF